MVPIDPETGAILRDPETGHPMPPPTRPEAIAMLQAWHKATGQRDYLVRLATSAGLSKTEIYQHTGISRSTIDRILSGRPDG